MFNRDASRRARIARRNNTTLKAAIRPCVESLEIRTLLSADFTIATLSDTQYTVESFPNTFTTQTAWVAAHGFGGTAGDSFPNNIAFFAHQGDMLRRGYSDFQAANADAALSTLNGKVPYTVSIGNHDYDNQFDDLDQHVSSANFAKWFGNARFANIAGSGFGGSSLDQRNRFHTFTAAGREYLVLSIEWEPSDASIAWAQSVINSHRQDPVIISTHEYLNSSGRTQSTLEPLPGYNAGEGIYQKLVKPNPQVFMTLSGHTGAIRSQTSLNNASGSVYEIVADFEGRSNGGDGWMQLLGFDLAANTITGTNYSPTLNQSEAGPLFSNVNFNSRFAFYAAGAPISNDDTLNVAPGQSLAFDPRANDVDTDGTVSSEAITYSTLPAGVTYDSGTGLFTYAPGAFRGNVSFTYTLNDGVHTSNTATVTLRANNAPTATSDAVSTPESKAITINVLANDSDDADALKPILASLPAYGAVYANTDGIFTYTPDPKFAGTDSFTYVVSDGKAVSAPATVSINLRPAAPVYDYPISETTNAGTRTGSFANLLASDNSVESIQEVISSGADVDQRWRFNVTGGSDVTLAINAWRSFSNPGTGDEYHPQYSTDGATWTDLALMAPTLRGSHDITRTRFEANEPYQLWALPAATKGTVYIRATDTISSDTVLDTLTVDEIFIRSGVAFPQVSISAADGAESSANNQPVTFTVTRTGSGASIRNPLTVSYALSGTATPGDPAIAGTDYAAPAATAVTIPAGANSATFSLSPIVDSNVEGVETIIATLAPDPAYDLAPAPSATGNIADLGPTSLAATANTDPSSPAITLAWTDNNSDETAVVVQRGTDGITFADLVTLPANSVSYTDAGLPQNTTYFYRVRAVSNSLATNWSNTASAKTPTPADTTPPSQPAILTITSTSTTASLTWSASTDDVAVTGYDVYQNGSLRAPAVTGTAFTDTGLSSSTQYSYYVIARDAAGNQSAASATASITTRLAAPTLLTGSRVRNKQARLTWRDNSASESGFYLYSSKDQITWTRTTISLLSGSGGTQTATITTPSNGKWYFKVTAYDVNGVESDPSNLFNITL